METIRNLERQICRETGLPNLDANDLQAIQGKTHRVLDKICMRVGKKMYIGEGGSGKFKMWEGAAKFSILPPRISNGIICRQYRKYYFD